MHKVIIYTFISCIILFNLTDANAQSKLKKQSIPAVMNNAMNRCDTLKTIQLLYGSTQLSFDKILPVNKNTLICYDKINALFVLLDIKSKKIIDKLSLKDEKELNNIKNKEHKYYYFDFFQNYSNYRNNTYYFTDITNNSPIIKVNDTLFNIGFFTIFDTKDRDNQLLQLIIVNNKIRTNYIRFSPKLFSDFDEINYSYPHLTDFSTSFRFQNNDYLYSLFHPSKGSNYKTYHYISEITNSKLNIISKEQNPDLYHGKYIFLEYKNHLYQYAKDTLIIRNNIMEVIYSTALEDNSLKNNKSYYLIDATTNELFNIIESRNNNEYKYKIRSVEFENGYLQFNNSKVIHSSIRINYHGIINHELLFIKKDPLYNTDYIYSCNLKNFNDSISLDFKIYNEVSALKYQNLIKAYQQESFTYEVMKNKIIKDLAKNNSNKDIKIKNKNIGELFASLKSLLNNEDYYNTIKKLLVFEANELEAYDFYKSYDIIKHFTNPVNKTYFNSLKNDIDELIKLYPNNDFDFSNNLTFYKTSTNKYYTVVKLKNKYYLRASIGHESNKKDLGDINLFRKKYKYLKYENPKSDEETSSFFFNDSSIIAQPMGQKLSEFYFPGIIESQEIYPQKRIKDLFKSLDKCFKENKLSYVNSQLMAYPNTLIKKLKNEDCKHYFERDQAEPTQLEITKLFFANKYKKNKLSRNIVTYKFKLSNGFTYETILIRINKKWYLYSTVNVSN